jgi:molybdate transport system permease protein
MPASRFTTIILRKRSRLLLLVLVIASCGSGVSHADDDRSEITVSAASSLSDAFEALRSRFEDGNPNIRVRFNFGGSDLLQRQIEAGDGAGVDVFAPAGAGPMSGLIARGLVDEADRRWFAGNTLVLIRPRDGGVEVQTFADLADTQVRRVAIGSEATPVGRYARQVLHHLDLWSNVEDRLVSAMNARLVLDLVSRGEVDAGIVYATDAAIEQEHVVVADRAKREWHDPIAYPIAALGDPPARSSTLFVDFVTSSEGQAILASFGFTSPGEPPIRSTGIKNVQTSVSVTKTMSLTLMAAGGALLIVFPLGTALGALLAKRSFPGRELLDTVITLPMILPPTVTGYCLITALGARSALGSHLELWFGVRVPLTLLGAAIASGVIALPLMVKSARTAFESVDGELEAASYTLGKGRVATFFRITLPLARNGLTAGAILSFARAVGEFGATMMLAGMIPGKTMTAPLAIFHAFTTHDDDAARTLVIVLTAFSIVVIYVTNRLNAAGGHRPST